MTVSDYSTMSFSEVGWMKKKHFSSAKKITKGQEGNYRTQKLDFPNPSFKKMDLRKTKVEWTRNN